MCILCQQTSPKGWLETGLWRYFLTSQTAHTKYKWLPYATEWNPPHEKFPRTPLKTCTLTKCHKIQLQKHFKSFCFANWLTLTSPCRWSNREWYLNVKLLALTNNNFPLLNRVYSIFMWRSLNLCSLGYKASSWVMSTGIHPPDSLKNHITAKILFLWRKINWLKFQLKTGFYDIPRIRKAWCEKHFHKKTQWMGLILIVNCKRLVPCIHSCTFYMTQNI